MFPIHKSTGMFVATHDNNYMQLHVHHTYEHNRLIHTLNSQPYLYVPSECASQDSVISLIQRPLGQNKLPLLVRYSDFRAVM